MKIKLAIVDDNSSLAESLKLELERCPEIGLIRVYSGGSLFLKEIEGKADLPDVVLMDISMSVVDEGIKTTRSLHDHYPSIKVVMFTIAEDDEKVFDAFKAGAVGYLMKNEKPSFILKTIVDVHEGGALMSPGIALKAIRFLAPDVHAKLPEESNQFKLSDREIEVLRLVTKGFTYQTIGIELFISGETVKKHMANIFKKLHVKNKIEAINKAGKLL